MNKNRKRRILCKKVKTIAKDNNISKKEAYDLHMSRRPKRVKTKFTSEGLIFL